MCLLINFVVCSLLSATFLLFDKWLLVWCLDIEPLLNKTCWLKTFDNKGNRNSHFALDNDFILKDAALNDVRLLNQFRLSAIRGNFFLDTTVSAPVFYVIKVGHKLDHTFQFVARIDYL